MFKLNDTLLKSVMVDLDANVAVMLFGEPGTGKSSFITDLGRVINSKTFTFAANEAAEKGDVNGVRTTPVYDDAGTIVDYEQRFFPHADIRAAIEYAKAHPHETPILFIDEINRTYPDVTTLLLSIITRRAVGTVDLPSNLRIVCAGNDKGNVMALDEASLSRYSIYHIVPDAQTWLNVNPDANEHVKKVLTSRPDLIFCKATDATVAKKDDDDNNTGADITIDALLADDDGARQITCPRTLTMMSNWLNRADTDLLQTMLSEQLETPNGDISALKAKLDGTIGETEFSLLLFNELVNAMMTPQAAASTIKLTPPTYYDQLKQAPDIATLDQLISGMPEKLRSNSLIYALYERADNAAIIGRIATQLTAFEPDDVKVLMDLCVRENIDTENLKVFVNCGAPVANIYAPMLESYI